MLVLAVFLLVARRRFFACSVSLRSTLLVLPHASLLFCPFRFIRFLLHAALLLFVLVSRSFLFWPFSFLLSVSLSYHLPLRSAPVLFSLLRFHFWPLLLFVAFGIARFCSFGPSWIAGCGFFRARV